MKKFRINYSEGTCFAVPLRSGGFGRGIVSRLDRRGRVFGYFYGPLFSKLEEIPAVFPFTPEIAVMCGVFGDLGLVSYDWHVLGEMPGWNRHEWPLPRFAGKDGNFSTISELNDDLSCISRERISREDIPHDALKESVMGAGFVEIRLTKLLATT